MNRLVTSLLILLAVATQGQAIDFIIKDTLTLPPGKTLARETWAQAHQITLEGEAADDCFLLADSFNQSIETNLPTVRLAGRFGADVWAAGETIDFSGAITNHARLAAARTLLVSGSVGKSLMAMAPTISLSSNALISGSALLAGQDIILSGRVEGPLRVIGTTVTLAGDFKQDISVTAGDITVMPGTRIGGNFTYHMDHDLVLDSRVDLGGRMIRKETATAPANQPATGVLLFQLALLCGAILTGMVFVSLMPGTVALSVHKLVESPWRCLLQGFVAFALMPMAAFFLVFTLVGIPLSVVIGLCYLVLMYVAKIIVGLYAGHLLVRRRTPLPTNLLFPVMSLGLLFLYAATSLPFPFGAACWVAITLGGMGALAGAIMDRRVPVMVSYQNPENPAKPPPLPGATPPGAV